MCFGGRERELGVEAGKGEQEGNQAELELCLCGKASPLSCGATSRPRGTSLPLFSASIVTSVIALTTHCPACVFLQLYPYYSVSTTIPSDGTEFSTSKPFVLACGGVGPQLLRADR